MNRNRFPAAGQPASSEPTPRLPAATPTRSDLPSWITQFAAELDQPSPADRDTMAQAAKAQFMTINEVAAALRVSTRTVRRLVASGRLSFVRIGRSIRIPREVVDWPRNGEK